MLIEVERKTTSVSQVFCWRGRCGGKAQEGELECQGDTSEEQSHRHIASGNNHLINILN